MQTTRRRRAISGKYALSYVELELAPLDKFELGLECFEPGENNFMTSGETLSFNK